MQEAESLIYGEIIIPYDKQEVSLTVAKGNQRVSLMKDNNSIQSIVVSIMLYSHQNTENW